MKNQNQNLLIAVAIWLACMAGLYVFFPSAMGRRAPDQKPASSAQPGTPGPAAAPASPGGMAPADAPKGPDVPRGTSAAKYPVRTVTLETPRARIVATSEGGAIQSLRLLGEKWTRHKGAKDESQVDLVGAHAGEPLPFSTAVTGADGAVLIPATASYQVVHESATSATFRAEQGGVTITKTFSVSPGTYGIALAVEVKAVQAVAGNLALLSGAHADEPQGGFFSPHSVLPARSICAANNKVERLAIGAKHPLYEAQAAQFAGIDEQYFLSAVLPPAGVPATCRLEAHGEKSGSLISTLSVPLQIAAGGSTQLAFQGYAGPKGETELVAVAAPLKQSIDLGFWSVIAELLLGIMKFFYRAVPPHNWGLAIILLTFAMKALRRSTPATPSGRTWSR